MTLKGTIVGFKELMLWRGLLLVVDECSESTISYPFPNQILKSFVRENLIRVSSHL